jgi:hypothetical protein
VHPVDHVIRILKGLGDVPGSNVNAGCGMKSLLRYVPRRGEFELVEELLGFRELNLSNTGVNRTALICAPRNSHIAVAERLIEVDGFDINYVSDSGESAFACAVMNTLPSLVAKLKSSPRFDV